MATSGPREDAEDAHGAPASGTEWTVWFRTPVEWFSGASACFLVTTRPWASAALSPETPEQRVSWPAQGSGELPGPVIYPRNPRAQGAGSPSPGRGTRWGFTHLLLSHRVREEGAALREPGISLHAHPLDTSQRALPGRGGRPAHGCVSSKLDLAYLTSAPTPLRAKRITETPGMELQAGMSVQRQACRTEQWLPPDCELEQKPR